MNPVNFKVICIKKDGEPSNLRIGKTYTVINSQDYHYNLQELYNWSIPKEWFITEQEKEALEFQDKLNKVLE